MAADLETVVEQQRRIIEAQGRLEDKLDRMERAIREIGSRMFTGGLETYAKADKSNVQSAGEIH